jgi:hypothetical protein
MKKFNDWWENVGLNFAHRDACLAAFALGALKTVEKITGGTDALAKRALESVGSWWDNTGYNLSHRDACLEAFEMGKRVASGPRPMSAEALKALLDPNWGNANKLDVDEPLLK